MYRMLRPLRIPLRVIVMRLRGNEDVFTQAHTPTIYKIEKVHGDGPRTCCPSTSKCNIKIQKNGNEMMIEMGMQMPMKMPMKI